MTTQWLVICYTFRVEIWSAYDDDSVLVNPDAAFRVDGTLHVYKYKKGKNAELSRNWRERCAIEAHYHAKNQGESVVSAIVSRIAGGHQQKVVDERQMYLPFDTEENN